ncbi:MAG: ComEA family DNA-binding protein [Candidatus Electrothrix sp. YB6]
MKTFYLSLFFVLFFAAAAFAAVNINTASESELKSLPGIGTVKAQAIIKYRKEKGQFRDISDLQNVYGIGQKIIERLKDEITVGGVVGKPAAGAAVRGKEKTKEKTAKDTQAAAKTAGGTPEKKGTKK